MKDFFKSILSSCLGVFLAIFSLFILFAFIGFVGSLGSDDGHDGILKLDLTGAVPELSDNVETSFLDAGGSTLGLSKIEWMLAEAKEDDEVKGIYLQVPSSPNGPATLSTLKAAIRDFKESGKFVYAYSDYYSQSGYFLSSVADSLFLNPRGGVDVKGYGTMIPFFKGALDKLGAGFTVSYAGDFKSATEPFRRTNMSDQNKKQTREYLDDLYKLMQEDINLDRNITPSELDRIITNVEGRNAERSLSNGLVDKIAYEVEVEELMKSKIGKEKSKKIKFLSLSDYAKKYELKKRGSGKDRIAVVYAEGTVVYGQDGKGNINESTYPKIFQKLADDKKVKAVVLRVNSGGGSALTSDIIWHSIEEFKKSGKPVIASFGNYAASGGYYIAAGADTIVSQPNTLTGSIGVFSMLPYAGDLMRDKLGITFDTVKTHESTIMLSPFYDVSSKEMALLNEGTNEVYDRFLSVVAQGRDMSVDDVHQVAQGRVWTGRKAVDNGLVDVLGSLDDAIEIAAETAGLDKYKLVNYPKIKKSFIDEIVQEVQKDMVKHTLGTELNNNKVAQDMNRYIEFVNDLSQCSGVQARLPFLLVTD